MKKVGVWPAKAMPPHRGHLSVILNASTLVEKLYVVVSEHEEANGTLCETAGIPYISGAQRVEWLKEELKDMPHIEVKLLNENNMPIYPNGWDLWTKELQNVVGEHIDMFFCGQKDIDTYEPKYKKYFPDAETMAYDLEAMYFNISATEIRSNPIKHWDYILGSARPFFAKKILITGTKENGKSILTRALAKMYHTSWSEDNSQDEQALRTCNRICFFDKNDSDFKNYDYIFIINDGERYNELLKNIYECAGYKIIEVNGTYNERLQFILNKLKEIL